ncbi:MAG TPA: hypothetical protein VHG72_03380 [Polyangia bacterium]|nr:hypothetical protein [Polyangia bacterium]
MRARLMRRLAWLLGTAALLHAGVSHGAAGSDRHPSPRLMARPASVPADYVLTHNGWFHRSCVVRVQPDERVGADRVIRGPDGAARFTLAPCAYPRFQAGGQAVTGSAARPPAHAPPPAIGVYDGYIVYYSYAGSLPTAPTLVTSTIVPPAPTNVGDQDIAFFNDIETSAGGGDILQPVLDFNGEIPGLWSIESEHCCIDNNDMQTTPVPVAPGDTIQGTVTGSDCDATGACQAWAVTAADVTTGGTTTLNTTAPGGVPNALSPASLETYGVSSCDMFPAGGETTFTGNRLTDAGGNVQTNKYRLITLDQVAAEVPRTCGYGGRTTGDDEFTLIYGAVPALLDGGAAGGGGAGAGGQPTGGTTGTGGASVVAGGGAGVQETSGGGGCGCDASAGGSSLSALCLLGLAARRVRGRRKRAPGGAHARAWASVASWRWFWSPPARVGSRPGRATMARVSPTAAAVPASSGSATRAVAGRSP